jgi:hypothetical protein
MKFIKNKKRKFNLIYTSEFSFSRFWYSRLMLRHYYLSSMTKSIKSILSYEKLLFIWPLQISSTFSMNLS